MHIGIPELNSCKNAHWHTRAEFLQKCTSAYQSLSVGHQVQPEPEPESENQSQDQRARARAREPEPESQGPENQGPENQGPKEVHIRLDHPSRG